MSDAKLVNIARLMTTHNFDMEKLPSNLKCAQCKLVLKDACLVPCCCRFCRACIDDMLASGVELCPGVSEECGESPLSRFTADYVANKRVSKLVVKCPHEGCVHECQLANMEEHMRECTRNTEECPFHKLGCIHAKMAAEEMDGHLQHESRKHSDILIDMIVNISKEIETLKQKDEASSRQIDMMKHELDVKDEQIRSIMDQMIHVQNENKSIKNDIKSIKEENEVLSVQLRILSSEIEREITERHENDELDSARVIEHVDREIAAVTGLIGANKADFEKEVKSIRRDVGSINVGELWMKNIVRSMKPLALTKQTPIKLEYEDAKCDWLIDTGVSNTRWGWRERLSEYFSGEAYPYKYRLGSKNYVDSTLYISLHIHAGPNDEQLMWPFEAKVVVTITDRNKHKACKSIALLCQIERPPRNECSWSDYFVFRHSELTDVGLNLSNGVLVACSVATDISR